MVILSVLSFDLEVKKNVRKWKGDRTRWMVSKIGKRRHFLDNTKPEEDEVPKNKSANEQVSKQTDLEPKGFEATMMQT